MSIPHFPRRDEFVDSYAHLRAIDDYCRYKTHKVCGLLILIGRTRSSLAIEPWVNDETEIIHVAVDVGKRFRERRKAALEGLISVALERHTKIVRVCHGRMKYGEAEMWCCYAELKS